jgi:uncharacterized membrane protein (DUF106 family)
MKRRGGSLDNSTVFYIVVVVAVFNLIAYLSVRDWTSIACFVLAGLVTYAFDTNKTVVLVIAIITATLVRITRFQRDGMENKKKEKVKEKIKEKVKERKEIPESHEASDLNPMEEFKNALSGSNLEGLQLKTDKLMKHQKDIFHMAQNLKPMMEQATELMKSLPNGFLEKAMKNFN